MNYQYKSDFIDIVDFFKNTGIYTYKFGNTVAIVGRDGKRIYIDITK